MTTIIGVAKGDDIVIAGDGQVSLGQTVIKGTARKVRRLSPGGRDVVGGFAGSTADAFALMERFEEKIKDYPGNIARAATELARDWRTDRALRRLEAMMLVADTDLTLLLSGQGDVVQPTDGVVGIGSGGAYATSAAKALVKHSDLTAVDIVKESLSIAAEIEIYTNTNIIIEDLPSNT